MSRATGIDHVGIAGRDLTSLAATFQHLGFCLTPLARHASGRTGNRCVMLRNGGYLELMSTIGGGPSATLERFLIRHAGAHILALEIDDEDPVIARLRLAWGAAPEVSHTGRAVDDTDAAGPRARFTLMTPSDRPEGRVHLIRHLTPGVLWQERFVRHENGAVALEEVILAVPEPATTAAWFSVLAGRPVVPDSAGGYSIDLTRGRVRVLYPVGFATVMPGVSGPSPPCIAGLTLRTDDGNAAVLRLLADRAIPFQTAADSVMVEAGGVTLRFSCRTA
jgi:hypothetical protein